jgi:nucleoside-diphosphate-sugar epimerase
MRVMIVGGSSALASTLLPVLSSFAQVLTAGRSGCDVALDLAWDADQINLIEGLDAVVHLAAHFGGKNFDEILAAEQVNVLGSLKLCHAAKRAGVGYFLLVSSIYAGLEEDSPFFNSYALSKRHAEDVAQLYCASVNLPLAVLRPPQIYGVGPTFRKHQPFLYEIIDKAANNEDIDFYGSNDATRNLIHAEDVAEIIARMVQQRILGRHVCPSMVNLRYSEIAATAISAFESTSSIHFAPDKPSIRDNAFKPDGSLYRRIEFFPCVPITLGMKKEAFYRKGLK